MLHLTSGQHNPCLPVSLWQGTELLGWFRAQDIDNTGMLVTGPINRLADNSMVTVAIEMQQQGDIVTHQVKALVMHKKYNAVELWWADQQTDRRPLMRGAMQRFV